MTFQRLSISFILIVLSIVHVNALVRQTNGNCSSVNMCNFVNCNYGTCLSDATAANCFKCLCQPGYTGQLCDSLLTGSTTCNPPCQNNGLCIPNGVDSVCACRQDFTGNQCETNLFATHVCVTAPDTVCKNGGTCTINGADYLCNCPTGFSGVNCEIGSSTTTCTQDFCGAHGTCHELILQTGEFVAACICESQWIGVKCEIPVSTTATMTSPITITDTTMTTSTTGTTMTTATVSSTTTTGVVTPAGDCSKNPCLNGGSCYNTGNTFICLCRQEYSGPTCSALNPVTTTVATTASTTNACSPNPCNNGGTCYKYGAASFVCLCTTAYAGHLCDVAKTTISPSNTTPTPVAPCAQQPCKNGATCYNAGNSYYCYCGANSNFNGVNCDTPKATSDSTVGCSLSCGSGYCVLAGSGQNAYACMCNGVLKPTSC